jgi:uncharacterized protein
MIGVSYAGAAQWWAAVQRPPHLVAMIPNVSPPDPFYNFPYEYGVFFLLGAIWWSNAVESQVGADISGAALSKTFEKKYTKLLRALPVIELDKAVLGKKILTGASGLSIRLMTVIGSRLIFWTNWET